MAEEKVEGREVTWRQLFPWTELFRGFQVALDPNKLLLAAAGILAMTVGWVGLSAVFSLGYQRYAFETEFKNRPGKSPDDAYKEYRDWLKHWNLMHETANVGGDKAVYELGDVAESFDEYDKVSRVWNYAPGDTRDGAPALLTLAGLRAAIERIDDDIKQLPRKAKELDDEAAKPEADKDKDKEKSLDLRNRARDLRAAADRAAALKKEVVPDVQGFISARPKQYELLGKAKLGGTLSTWPFFEDRGPNPVLLVTGQAKAWEQRGVFDWLFTTQVPVLIEPLIKMLRPIAYLFDSRADTYVRFYFFLVAVWTLAVWSLFGGAITRIAAVQIARGEKINLIEAISFTRKRLLSYLTAPLFPLLLIFILLVFMVIYGFFFMIPFLGDILVAGVFWPVMLVFGAFIAVALVGLVGWPLMAATVSTEGTDSWEAFSRSYSYVFQRPWHYLWYSAVTIFYGAVVLFFIGFMGSFIVYLSKWGVSRTFWIDSAHREPSFLFIYAPKSFGWRELLLHNATTNGDPNGAPVVKPNGEIDDKAYKEYTENYLQWWNKVGAFLVSIWIYLLFLLVLGFGYSFFWSTMTITYLLLRKSVDTAEMDEVYLEEDDQEGPYSGPLAGAAAAPPPGAIKGSQPVMVDAPALRTPSPTPSPQPTPPTSPAPSPEPAKPAEKAAEKPAEKPAEPSLFPPSSAAPAEEGKKGDGGDAKPPTTSS
jgi:hypothetical protein